MEATWVVIQPVADAITVLEQLTDRDYLFWPSRTFHDLHEVSFDSRRLLKRFCNHINGTYQHDDPPPIPHVEGSPWRLNSRQFRRTLAWYIANQPFGVVAG